MFAKLSSVEALNLKIQVDNLFILEYMPYAPESYVKVYLYGLSLASHNLDADNSLARIAKRLDLDEATVLEAFRYWEDNGVVRLAPDGSGAEYLPVRPVTEVVRKIPKGKYESFTAQLGSMIKSRMISQSEYARYYDLMENLHVEPEAMLALISYCLRFHGEKTSVNYIAAVARNLAFEGNTTYDKVVEALNEYDNYTADLAEILKALKTTRKPDAEDRRLYLKWIKTYGFDLNTVLETARRVKHGGIARLDAVLEKYNEQHLKTKEQIDEHIAKLDAMYELTRTVVKRLGISLERLDYTIEVYTSRWLSLGYDSATLEAIADYCYRSGKRTLEAMNNAVSRFYAKGLVSGDAFSAYVANDVRISELLATAGCDRPVGDYDRECYRTWTQEWKMGTPLLKRAAEAAAGKENPTAYMNKILSGWHAGGVTDPSAIPDKAPTVSQTYSSDELNEIFNRLTEEDI